MKRFWDKVRKTDSCWIWTAGCFADGYGGFQLGSSVIRAHRQSYILMKGPIPIGLYVLHKCDNPKCVNPDHLFLGTNADNMADMVAKGRHVGSAKITKKQSIEIKKLVASGLTQKKVGLLFGLCQSAISRIVTGYNWR